MQEDISLNVDQGRIRDTELVKQIMAETHCTNQPTDMRRLGNKSKANEEGMNKPRPLRLSFISETARDEFIHTFRRATNKITHEGDERYISKIAIGKDMTPAERQEEQALFLE